MTVTATCECGKCEFRVEGDPSDVYRCHCADCREVGGEDYFHIAIIPAEQARTDALIPSHRCCPRTWIGGNTGSWLQLLPAMYGVPMLLPTEMDEAHAHHT